ncbi:MAG: MFS transporter, partial [Deltaproteobacteria bacterium]
MLPESDVWRARRLPAHEGPLRVAPYLGRAFGLAVLNMSSYWLTYTWLPTYLREERGLSIAGSGTKVLVVVLGELLGYASFGLVSDRFGRRPAFSVYATLMAVGLVAITLLWPLIVGWPPLLLGCLWLVGFGTGTWSNFGPMFAELFPTAGRRWWARGSTPHAACSSWHRCWWRCWRGATVSPAASRSPRASRSRQPAGSGSSPRPAAGAWSRSGAAEPASGRGPSRLRTARPHGVRRSGGTRGPAGGGMRSPARLAR